MKQYLLVIALLLSIPVIACDICGCGVGNNYIGVLPEFRKHIIGLRYRYNSIATHVGIGGATTYLTTNEHYKTAELWGGFQIASKWRLLVTVPYNFNSRYNSAGKSTKQGIGDVNSTIYYQLINKKNTLHNNKLLINNLWIGAGVKLPFGKYNPIDKNTKSSNNLFQLGTGSTDFSLAAMYDLRYQDVGLNINTAYKITTENHHQYQYANKFSISSNFYYKIKLTNHLTLTPNAGVLIEKSGKDTDNKEVVDVSGGTLTMRSFGVEATTKKIAVGFNWQQPQYQNLALGIIKAYNRAMIHISFIL